MWIRMMVAAASLMLVSLAQASYPEKPIRLLVGFPPGSSADAVARLFGHELGEAMGKPIVVDNVTGAAGNIAAERVAKAAPDGYTLGLLGEGQLVINPSLYRLAYDPVTDLAPVSRVALSPNLLVVNNGVSANSFVELIALARAKPGELTFASGGNGSAPHMAAVLLNSVAGLDIRHIPYKGVVAAIPDLLAGRVTLMFSPIAIVLPQVREGKLRALAVTSLSRSSAVPNLPTIAESGFPGFQYTVWYGLLAPAGTPSAIIRELNLEAAKVLSGADLRSKLADLGLETNGSSPDEFAAFIKAEIPKWAKVMKDAGIKPD
ncbi:MAG TPA: tripartite tricarboxylate transporter substrate binding protein [Burkholderiales bacterium]